MDASERAEVGGGVRDVGEARVVGGDGLPGAGGDEDLGEAVFLEEC